MAKNGSSAPHSDKTVGKTVQPGRNGGTLLVGNPGCKGGTGRPPNEWKARMAKIADRWAKAVETQKVVDNPKHPHFMKAGQFAAEQAHGQASKNVDLTTGGEMLPAPQIVYIGGKRVVF